MSEDKELELWEWCQNNPKWASRHIYKLKKALQEIVELAKGPAEPSLGDYGEGAKAAWDDAAGLARDALEGDDWHHEGDDITEPPMSSNP